MSGKHTPGPWNVEFGCNGVFDIETNHEEYRILASWYPRKHYAEESEANGRLIAAAPELLEALEAAMEWAEHCKLPTDIRVRMESAIAKAKGTPA